jgi:hypothetical protein
MTFNQSYASHATLLLFVLQAHPMVRLKYFRFVWYVCVIICAHKLMLMNYAFHNLSCCFDWDNRKKHKIQDNLKSRNLNQDSTPCVLGLGGGGCTQSFKVRSLSAVSIHVHGC